MSRSRFSSYRRQPTVFLNRHEQLRLIDSHVALLHRDPSHFKVLEIRGLGGVGKTRLLNELRLRAGEDDQTNRVLWVPLEAEAAATETGPLRAVREQLNFDCLLFDTALLTYWNATGQPFQPESLSRVTRSLAFKSLDVGRSVAGIPLPLNFAVDVYRSVSRKRAKARWYRKEEFEVIDELRLDPSGLRTRLPHWLGVDLRRRLESENHKLVALYDGYDKQASGTRSNSAPWLRELIGTLDRGLHVIATREPLQWDDRDWRDVVQAVRVDELPDAESREMIRGRLGTLSPEIEDRLIDASSRIPFFLEAAIDAYDMRSRAAEPVDVGELPASATSAVPYLLDHLTLEQRTVAIALAALQAFDASLYAYLIRALHVPISVLQFEEFVGRFFVEELSPGVYKTHDLLTASVRKSEEDETTRRAALEAATLYLLARCHGDAHGLVDDVLPIFRGVREGWRSVESMPPKSAEALIDVGYVLYDAGYWRELAATATEPTGKSHPSDVIAEFFAALIARRTVGVGRALELFERLETRVDALGRHARSAELEVAYLSELSGNYAKARQEFRQLDERAAPFDPADRTKFRCRLYHADMLINDGDFESGSRLLLEAYELVGLRARVDWAELVRHRGHALRFSFLWKQAEDLYLQALRAAADAPALLGKLQTNLAETYCWYDPPRALEAASLSTEISLRLGNRIELLKCDAARGIALAKLGEFRAARDAVATAAAYAKEIGYPAGRAFSEQAGALVEGLAGNADGLVERTAALSALVAELGTYSHLRVAPAWLHEDDGLFVDAALEVAWVAGDELEDRLRSTLGG